MTHVNGDQATYLDLTFACTYLRGDAHVADDESSDVRWFPWDALPEIRESERERMALALDDDPVTRFIS